MNQDKIKDRVRGSIIGGAIGGAISGGLGALSLMIMKKQSSIGKKLIIGIAMCRCYGWPFCSKYQFWFCSNEVSE